MRQPQTVASVLLVAFGLGSVLNRFILHGVGYRGSAYQLDLDVYRHGALAWLQGAPVAGPYHLSAVSAPMPFTYPPIAAVLFVPTTWASWRIVMAAWTAATIVALLVTLVLVASAAGLGRRSAWLLGMVGTGVCVNLEPVATHLQLGQLGIFLMALVVIDLAHEGRRWPRGILLGLAIAIKLNPAVFGLYLLLRRDWRAMAITAVSAVGFTCIGWVLAPADSVAYGRDLAGLGNQVVVFNASNISLSGFVSRLPGGAASPATWLVLSLATVALSARAMVLALRRNETVLALAINGLLLPLLSPAAWEHHWVWVCALTVVFIVGAFRGSTVMGALALATALMFRETSVSGGIPGSWVLYIIWAGLILLLLNWSGSYPPVASRPEAEESSSIHGAAAV